jgi:hypothetical protein
LVLSTLRVRWLSCVNGDSGFKPTPSEMSSSLCLSPHAGLSPSCSTMIASLCNPSRPARRYRPRPIDVDNAPNVGYIHPHAQRAGCHNRPLFPVYEIAQHAGFAHGVVIMRVACQLLGQLPNLGHGIAVDYYLARSVLSYFPPGYLRYGRLYLFFPQRLLYCDNLICHVCPCCPCPDYLDLIPLKMHSSKQLILLARR